MQGSMSQHDAYAKCTLSAILIIATCIGMSAESTIALCLLVQLFISYAKKTFVSELPVTILHVSAMS